MLTRNTGNHGERAAPKLVEAPERDQGICVRALGVAMRSGARTALGAAGGRAPLQTRERNVSVTTGVVAISHP